MRVMVMVMVKATKSSEAGEMPGEELMAAMGGWMAMVSGSNQ